MEPDMGFFTVTAWASLMAGISGIGLGIWLLRKQGDRAVGAWWATLGAAVVYLSLIALGMCSTTAFTKVIAWAAFLASIVNMFYCTVYGAVAWFITELLSNNGAEVMRTRIYYLSALAGCITAVLTCIKVLFLM
jgi:hypothetical protein